MNKENLPYICEIAFSLGFLANSIDPIRLPYKTIIETYGFYYYLLDIYMTDFADKICVGDFINQLDIRSAIEHYEQQKQILKLKTFNHE